MREYVRKKLRDVHFLHFRVQNIRWVETLVGRNRNLVKKDDAPSTAVAAVDGDDEEEEEEEEENR